MSFKFYYDALLEDENLTYTIYAKNSGSKENVNNFVSSRNNKASLNFNSKDLDELEKWCVHDGEWRMRGGKQGRAWEARDTERSSRGKRRTEQQGEAADGAAGGCGERWERWA